MLGWWKNVLTYPVAKDKQNRKFALTLPNLVYKGNETNSVNSGQIVLTLPNNIVNTICLISLVN